MRLLTKTTILYIALSLVIFIAGGITFYYVLNDLIYEEVDERLMTEKNNLSEQLQSPDDINLIFSSIERQVEIMSVEEFHSTRNIIKDTTILVKHSESDMEYLPFRELMFSKTLEGKKYLIAIRLSLLESDDLAESIFSSLLYVFLAALLLLILLNFFLSRRLWHPFYILLEQLNKYSITKDKDLVLKKTGTKEFRELNNTIDSLIERIKRSYQNLKEFTENASHEIQTPLSIIRSKLELLSQSSGIPEKEMKEISAAYSSVNRLSRLNQTLLLLAKIENMQFPEKEPVSPATIIEEFIDNFSELAESKSLTIKKQLNKETTILIHPMLAETLLSNLLNNAIKHNIPDGKIEIELAKKSLTIKNTGKKIDIAPEKLFERFKKGGTASQSLGLGLAIVKKICDTHGFSIRYSHDGNMHIFGISF